MELQEQVNALNAEKKQYISMIDNLNSEKLALDQMLVDSLKTTLECKKNLILKEATLNNLNNIVQALNTEKEASLKKMDELNASIEALKKSSVPTE